jgi:hypothetical protein
MREINALLELAAVVPLLAQSGTLDSALDDSRADSNTVVSGRVVGPDGKPLTGATATISARIAHATRSAITDSTGTFSVPMPSRDEYFVNVTAPRMAPLQLRISDSTGRAVRMGDIRMAFGTTMLAPVNVRQSMVRPDMPGTQAAGALETFIPPERADQFVANRNSLEALAGLVPGAIIGSGSDGALTYSVAGVSPLQNSVTINGATGSSNDIPRDAIAGAVVTTNTSDVARGRFGGGQVAAWTAHGSKARYNYLRISGTDPLLQTGSHDAITSSEFQDLRISGTSSGAVPGHQSSYFGTLEVNRRASSAPSFVGASDGALRTFGLSPDAVNGMMAQAAYAGIPLRLRGSSQRISTSLSGFLDLFSQRSVQSSIDVNFSGHVGGVRPLQQSWIQSPAAGTNANNAGAGAHLTWTTAPAHTLNIFQSTASVNLNRTAPALYGVPGASVFIRGDSSSGDDPGGSFLVLGGAGMSSQRSLQTAWETTNETSLETSDKHHRVKFGEFLRLERLSNEFLDDAAGRFDFASPGDFVASTPSSFTRRIGRSSHGVTAINGAIYLGDRYRAGRAVWEYGLRFETDFFAVAALRNKHADSVFALRTGRAPSESNISPRAGVTWRYGHGRGSSPRGEFRLNIGEYRGVMATGLVNNVTGLSMPTVNTLVCLGSAVPAPHWSAQGAPPTACINGSPATTSMGPNIAAFSPDYRAPRNWRATSTVTTGLTEGIVGAIDGLFGLGIALPSIMDRNLAAIPQFHLDAEGGRPVYVRAGDIQQAGFVLPSSSRVDSQYVHAWEYRSDLRSRTTQLTARLNFLTGYYVPGTWQVAYTWTDARDQMRGFSGDTDGDPRRVTWSAGDYQRRHQFLLTGVLPRNGWFSAYATARVASGISYTPIVGRDINGDGLADDRAFVFGPESADTASAHEIRGLTQKAGSSSARSCLLRQIGRIAGHNSCTGSWNASLDMVAMIRPERLGFGDRLSATVRFINVFAALDELTHGPSHLRGWGQSVAPDPVLLTPTGFDPSKGRFSYAANPHFGKTDAVRTGYVNPFQISLDIRIAIGPDPRRTELMAMLGADAGAPGKKLSSAQLKARFASRPQDPFLRILTLKDSLGLSPSQIAELTTMHAAYTSEVDTLWGAAASAIAARDLTADVGPSIKKLNDTYLEVQRRQIRWGHQFRNVLSPVQRAMAPLYVQHVMFDDESIIEPLIR